MYATAATAAGENPLHAVLTEMIYGMCGGSVKHTSVTASDGNWRTRQVIRELRGVKSVEVFFSTEEQIRGVVMSQETRCRVKLLNAFLSGQYLLEEQASVREEEESCRRELTLAALSELHSEASLLTVVGQEMYDRHSLENAYWKGRMNLRRCRNLALLVLREQISRRFLIQKEAMNRVEMERRTFLAVGREIDMELLSQELYRTTSRARFEYSKFTLDLALLLAEEERERCSVERMYLLKLSLMANDQENAAARLVVTSVMRASLMRRKLRDDAWWRERTSMLLLVPSKELDIRYMIERKEMEERQELRVSFLTTWRSVFKRTMNPDEGTAIIERLELYERRCVFDQWRFGFNALNDRQESERCILANREATYDVFYNSVVDSLTALWKQECEQFNALRKRYLDFVWSTRMVEATIMLGAEECAARQRIIESEAREAIKVNSSFYLRRCEEAALQGAASIMEMEHKRRISLMQSNIRAVRDVYFYHLLYEEACLRIDIESEARTAWSDIVLQESAPRGCSLDSADRLEDAQRTLLVRDGDHHFILHNFTLMVFVENIKRGALEEEELEGRVSIYAAVLGKVEEWNRLELQAEGQHEFSRILFDAVDHRECAERAILEEFERERREFLFGSFDYSLPHLRACEVDELDARLDIINEAELTVGALTCSWGMHCHVAYCSEELRLSQCTLRFMSSKELLQDRELALVRAVEPMSRREIINRERSERLLLLMDAQEEKGRIRIEKAATDAYNGAQELFDRILSRADDWRTRGVLREPVVLTGREALIDYFRRQEASVAVRLRAQQEKTRELLGLFFADFYWGRDSIVVEEFVGRESIMGTFFCPHPSLRVVGEESGPKLTVRFYSLALMTKDSLQSLSIRVNDSLDDVGVTCELLEAQAVTAAGRVFRVCFPVRVMTWVRPLAEESNVLRFEVRHREGSVVATASILLRSEELRKKNGATVVSLPTDDKHGKMNVVLHVE
ncbi:hypothetical protein MOQ_008458 [Trypanosoma cruzi marinkellei]|uniref:Uncharacterized protein n=1 Tax=Trypanosoma cruzi marinkellei TaxID=85056 RepID=K2MZJ8_TRYCR|nr:hypothetical protein MOQ_008458 [Trypanosoma cruzi marinkellei]